VKIVVIDLKKHWGVNTAGETAGVSPENARWILDPKNDGGVKLGEYDTAVERADVVTEDGKKSLKLTSFGSTAKK